MKTPVTQRSPCYSAVSALLTNPLPDHSNYSPLLPHPYLTPDQYINSLFGPDPLPSRSAGNYTSLLQRFTALQNLVRSSGETQCLEEADKQRQVSMFLILLFKLLTQFLYVSFLCISILSLSLSSLCSLSQSSLFSLSTISSDQIFVLLR